MHYSFLKRLNFLNENYSTVILLILESQLTSPKYSANAFLFPLIQFNFSFYQSNY